MPHNPFIRQMIVLSLYASAVPHSPIPLGMHNVVPTRLKNNKKHNFDVMVFANYLQDFLSDLSQEISKAHEQQESLAIKKVVALS